MPSLPAPPTPDEPERDEAFDAAVADLLAERPANDPAITHLHHALHRARLATVAALRETEDDHERRALALTRTKVDEAILWTNEALVPNLKRGA